MGERRYLSFKNLWHRSSFKNAQVRDHGRKKGADDDPDSKGRDGGSSFNNERLTVTSWAPPARMSLKRGCRWESWAHATSFKKEQAHHSITRDLLSWAPACIIQNGRAPSFNNKRLAEGCEGHVIQKDGGSSFNNEGLTEIGTCCHHLKRQSAVIQ